MEEPAAGKEFTDRVGSEPRGYDILGLRCGKRSEYADFRKMKLPLLVCVACVSLSFGQDVRQPPQAPPAEPAAHALRVLDAVPDARDHAFVPSPPAALPPIAIQSASTVDFGTHRVTVIRGEASTLPDIPARPRPRPVAVDPRRVEEPPPLPGRRRLFVAISATIHDHGPTRLEWRDPETQEVFEAWCAWDWTLVPPMIGEIDAGDAIYSVLSISQRGAAMPEPEVLADSGADPILWTGGDPGVPAGKPLLEAIHRFCLENGPALAALKQARLEHQADAEARNGKNPPGPRDHTIWLKPHRGSRYLPGARQEHRPAQGGDR